MEAGSLHERDPRPSQHPTPDSTVAQPYILHIALNIQLQHRTVKGECKKRQQGIMYMHLKCQLIYDYSGFNEHKSSQVSGSSKNWEHHEHLHK